MTFRLQRSCLFWYLPKFSYLHWQPVILVIYFILCMKSICMKCPYFPFFHCWLIGCLMVMICNVTGKGGCDPHAEDGENQTWSFRSSLWVSSSRERASSATQGRHPCPRKVYRGRCLWETNFRGNNFLIYIIMSVQRECKPEVRLHIFWMWAKHARG